MQNEPMTDNLIIVEDSEGTQALTPEIIRRGFFLIVTRGPDVDPAITFDVTMLPADVQRILDKAKSAAQDAAEVEIDSQEMFEYAATLRKQVRDDREKLEEARTKITARIDAFREAVMLEFRGDKTLKNGAVPVLENARLLLDAKLNRYLATEEHKAKEKQRIENERLKKEREAKEAEQRKLQEQADAETERLRKLAEQAAEVGDDDKVAELVELARDVADDAQDRSEGISDELAMMHPAPMIATALPSAAGFTPRKKWVCVIDDPIAFFQGIIDQKIPKAYGKWEPTKEAQRGLDAQAALLKKDMDYPGCHAEEKKGGSSR